MSYRVVRELMVLACRDNHQAATSVPIGTIISVLGAARDDRFLRIRVDCEEFEVFQTDVEERCDRLTTGDCSVNPPAAATEAAR